MADQCLSEILLKNSSQRLVSGDMTQGGAQMMQIRLLILLPSSPVVTTSLLEETFHVFINKYLEIEYAFPKLDSLLCIGNCMVKTPLCQS